MKSHGRSSDMTLSIVLILCLSCLLVEGFSTSSNVGTHHLSTTDSRLKSSNNAKMRLDSSKKLRIVMKAMLNDFEKELEGEASKNHIIFPGGGIFFYWQAGAVTYLREQKYDLSDVEFTGASAGALTATLAATNVDFEVATTSALQMAEDSGIWDRKLGLYGIWGPLIETWLDELLPEKSLEMVNERLSMLVTTFPTLEKNKISEFESKNDLIRCNMASVHLPLFLNGNLYTDFRDAPYIDGSFLSSAEDYISEKSNRRNLVLDWTKDDNMTKKSLLDSVNALSKQGIWDLLDQGRSYAKLMEKRGKFQHLPKL